MQKKYLMQKTYDGDKKIIEELLNADLSSIKDVANYLDFSNASIATLGNEKQIEENKNLFNKIRNLGV